MHQYIFAFECALIIRFYVRVTHKYTFSREWLVMLPLFTIIRRNLSFLPQNRKLIARQKPKSDPILDPKHLADAQWKVSINTICVKFH
jgi:hypothetical protein